MKRKNIQSNAPCFGQASSRPHSAKGTRTCYPKFGQASSQPHSSKGNQISYTMLGLAPRKPHVDTTNYKGNRNGAREGGSLSNTVNLIWRLFLYHFLHTVSSWCRESIHNNTNNQQKPSPWWWRRLPLQQCGFYQSTPSEWWVALRMYLPRPLAKDFVWFLKLM